MIYGYSFKETERCFNDYFGIESPCLRFFYTTQPNKEIVKKKLKEKFCKKHVMKDFTKEEFDGKKVQDALKDIDIDEFGELSSEAKYTFEYISDAVNTIKLKEIEEKEYDYGDGPTPTKWYCISYESDKEETIVYVPYEKYFNSEKLFDDFVNKMTGKDALKYTKELNRLIPKNCTEFDDDDEGEGRILDEELNPTEIIVFKKDVLKKIAYGGSSSSSSSYYDSSSSSGSSSGSDDDSDSSGSSYYDSSSSSEDEDSRDRVKSQTKVVVCSNTSKKSKKKSSSISSSSSEYDDKGAVKSAVTEEPAAKPESDSGRSGINGDKGISSSSSSYEEENEEENAEEKTAGEEEKEKKERIECRISEKKEKKLSTKDIKEIMNKMIKVIDDIDQRSKWGENFLEIVFKLISAEAKEYKRKMTEIKNKFNSDSQLISYFSGAENINIKSLQKIVEEKLKIDKSSEYGRTAYGIVLIATALAYYDYCLSQSEGNVDDALHIITKDLPKTIKNLDRTGLRNTTIAKKNCLTELNKMLKKIKEEAKEQTKKQTKKQTKEETKEETKEKTEEQTKEETT